MASIDERIVSMAFENTKFEANIAVSMKSLQKLSESLKMAGAIKGLQDIEAASHKVTLSSAGSAADKLKQKMEFSGAVKGLSDIEGAASKLTFGEAFKAADGFKAKFQVAADSAKAGLQAIADKLHFPGADRAFAAIGNAASKVNFGPLTKALDGVKEKLGFPGAERAFANIETSSKKVRFAGIQDSIAEVGRSFSILEGAAAVALGNIASKATAAGVSFVKGLTLEPTIGGLREYATNLNSIQTILANTEASGATLKDVNAALLQLNKYSDKTIYNFSQMAKNIGTFTAAGVDLETSVASIKGIANLAALSGSSSEQAATAMYQLSQAIAAGKVGLQDWNSVVNAGMGGATFQRALAQTAEQMGTIKKGALELKGPMKNVTIEGQSFRESIMAKPGEQSWLTSDVLTKTLEQFTGDMTDAELAAQGFSEAQIKAIQQTAKTATNAATQVKTLEQVFDVAKETIGSGWAQTFQLIFGDFGESKKTFTEFSNSINEFINKNAEARNKVLGDWKALGGRTVLIDGIKNAFDALGSVLKPIRDGFREIFPAKTGKDLYDLTVRFRDFMAELKIGPETADRLKRTFAGFFAILDIGKSVIRIILSVLGKLLGVAGEGSGAFLEFTGSIGDFLVMVSKAVRKVADFFSGMDSDGVDDASTSVDGLRVALSPLEQLLDLGSKAFQGFTRVLSNLGAKIKPLISDIANVFGDFGESVASALENADYDRVFQVIQTTLIGGIFFAIKKAMGGGLKLDFGTSAIENFNETLGAVTGNLKAMQRNIQAGTLLKIASALAVLAAGVVGISLVDPKRLASSMTAISVGLGQLVGAMALLTKIGGTAGLVTLPIITTSMILLATAIDVLAVAVFAFSKLNWEELGRGLVGVGGALVAIGVGVRGMPPHLLLISVGLLPMAAALTLLAGAVKIFSTMDWAEIGKGLVGVGGGLTAISVGVRGIGPSIILIGPGLVAVSAGLLLLSGAVRSFASLNLEEMGKGLLGIGASLGVLGLGLKAIPPTLALQAAGLVLVSVALIGISGAVALMGNLNMSTIAKGLLGLGGALGILALGLNAMAGTLPGALGLLAAAGALALLTPSLGILGKMKWSTLAKGLVAIGLAMAIIGTVGLLAGPGLLAVGVGLGALGLGVLAVGKGVDLLANGLRKLSGDGQKNLAIMVAAITAFIALIPKMVIDFVKGLVTIIEQIAKVAPEVAVSMGKIVREIVRLWVDVAPDVERAIIALIQVIVNVIKDKADEIVEAGFALLLALMRGIDNNINEVINRAGNIIAKLLTGIGNQLPRILAAGANTLVKFLDGLTSNLPRVLSAGSRTLITFLEGLTEAIPRVGPAVGKLIFTFIKEVGDQLPRIVDSGARLIIKFIEGIADKIDDVARAAVYLVTSFISAAAQSMLQLVDSIALVILNFLEGIRKAIIKYEPQFIAASVKLGAAIIQGFLQGLIGLAHLVYNKIKEIAQTVINAAGKLLKITSPSKVFHSIGENIARGWANGVGENGYRVVDAVEGVANDTVDTMRGILRVVPDILDELVDVDPTITPVLDLSQVEAQAKKLGELTNVVPITAAASFDQASAIVSEQETAARIIEEIAANQAPAEVKFEQNNYSPEALSDIEIYRQTQNQLSQAKKALGLVS